MYEDDGEKGDEYYNDFDLSSLQNEYDQCILDLHRKLQIAREERKKSQMDSKLLEHRVFLLQNQEKIAMQKFERTRFKLDQILNNRKFINYGSNLVKGVQEEKQRELERKREYVRMRKEINSQPSHQKSHSMVSKDLQMLNQIRASSRVKKFYFISTR
jgi:hypothetical protein